MLRIIRTIATTWLLCMVVLCNVVVAQMGHILDAVGPVNQSMAGAGIALPLDATSALHWNPASISWLNRSEIGFGFAAFGSEVDLSSQVQQDAFGPGAPPMALSGRTKSDNDINPIPTMGFVCHSPEGPVTFGLGGFAIGGFGVNYPGDPSNPILTPQPAQGGMGFGPIYSQFQLMQFAPTVSVKVSDSFSVGLAPTVNWATLAMDPFAAAIPNPDSTYAPATHADVAWGLGFQAGMMYQHCSGLSLGVLYKSPQWFQEFKFNSYDQLGSPRWFQFNMDYPAIFGVGLGWQGSNRWSLATDVKYVDYKNTDGFNAWGFWPSGAVRGFGWNSIWVVSTGVQYQWSPRLALRCGYMFNENPISSSVAFFNATAPGIIQHHLSAGFTLAMKGGWDFDTAFHHGFANQISGPWYGPNAIPNTAATSRLATYTLSVGLRKRF
ncbi:MAG: outer membrane protein transport protein [Planctomycetales bacterium]|nr:outer membrane protein transport protein [Planctomycetales bacterium]